MNQEQKYTIVALPERSALDKLNAIRTYLYSNGFRYSNSQPKNDVHITIAQLVTSPDQLTNLQHELTNKLDTISSFEVKYDHITDESQLASDKYPNGSVWISLFFKDINLKNLAELVDSYLIGKEISATKDYVSELGLDTETDLYANIANHMNLCNYARPDKAQEAKNYIQLNAPKSFIIDTIALRNEVGELIWQIKLVD